MNGYTFARLRGPILVEASASGPGDSADLRLILDTGATTTLLNENIVRFLGLNPDEPASRANITMTGSIETCPIVTLNRLTAFGQHRLAFPVISHSLPLGSGIDGLLGLDFLRGHVLTIDFTTGRLSLN